MMDELIAKYIQLRDKKAALRAEYDAKVGTVDAALTKIEGFLLTQMQEQGLKSMPTGAGTAYIQHRTSASIADWDSYKAFCLEQDDPFRFIEKRPNKTSLEEYRAANDDLPPGINWNESVVVNVKRS